LKTLFILYLEKVTNDDLEQGLIETIRWLGKRVTYFISEYKAMLETGEYDKAAEFYESAVRYRKYKPLIDITYEMKRTRYY
jgi:hypothetical protein